MENKKTKLTISGNPKKSFEKFDPQKTQGKKTVVIDKQTPRASSKGKFYKPLGSKPNINFKKGVTSKPNFIPKAQTSATDFERRKLAEQRATKRLKGDVDNKDKKSKTSSKKRELKLTVSRALSDEIWKTKKQNSLFLEIRRRRSKNLTHQKLKEKKQL